MRNRLDTGPLPPLEPLLQGVVRVWVVDLASVRPSSLPALAPDELQRASKFRSERGRSQFVRARGVLRAVLGSYVGEAPERLVFGYGPHGKPYLPAHRIEFSVSHAGDWAAYALSEEHPVGVDIEQTQSGPADLDLIKQIVAPVDYAAETLGEHGTLGATDLVALWTMKEAAVKAAGVGIGAGPQNVVIGGLQDDGARRAVVTAGEREPRLGWVRAFEPVAGYVGAVAACGQRGGVRVAHLPASALSTPDRNVRPTPH